MRVMSLNLSREELISETGMVAALHPLASLAGVEILQKGGNAVDAAVATAFALAVVQPQGSGLGGGGYMVLHQARTGRIYIVDYAMVAPAAATPDAYELENGIGPSIFGWRKVRGDANMLGYRAASVPGMVRGLALALERFGTLPLAEVMAPAIRYAENGVPVTWSLTLVLAAQMSTLSRYPSTAEIFLPGGFPPAQQLGSYEPPRLVQADLARTLRMIASDGPDAFYEGEFARATGKAMRDNGGLITEEDLAAYRPLLHQEGLGSSYRGYRVVGPPDATGAVTVLESLNLFEEFDFPAMRSVAPETLHLKAEAFRLAFADRYQYLADPGRVPVPLTGLLSKEYARERSRRIDGSRASERAAAGDPWLFETEKPGLQVSPPGRRDAPVPGTAGLSTTHLCAVDANRNAVSLTQTLVRPFGCGVVVPGTGVLLNNAMAWFDPEPGKPNSAAPGKRGVNNMAPMLVLKDGDFLMGVGAQGGRKIIGAVAQVISNVVDHGMGAQEAISTPRIDCSEPEMLAESRLPVKTIAKLRAVGHRVRVVEEVVGTDHFAIPVAITVDRETGWLRGGVHPLGEAVVAGY